MSSLKRFVACASAVALATGTTLAGAGIASAQEGEETTGSLSSSSLNLGETVADLETAAKALNGPVTVVPNDEGGPTVTYVNETETDQQCLGFTAPYSTIVDQDLDTNYDPTDLVASLELVNALEDGGNISIISGDDEGLPITSADPNLEAAGDVQAALIQIVLGNTAGTVLAGEGDEVEWTVASPDTSALAVLACVPVGGGDLETYTGIDKQVVADQINGKIPGGSVEPVSAGSISGGSVDTGVSVLGSLASASADSEEEPVEPPVETPAE